MSVVATLPRELAKTDPGAVFSSPEDVVHEVLLTRGEKIATLKRWRQEVALQLRAADDGMSTRRTSAEHVDLMQRIGVALLSLAPRS
ncbi:MAG: hypothetical protein JSS20_16120 [Proteobacteria bacterium]|nr:hypothetical protein [Pseudomonadota bacterium]